VKHRPGSGQAAKVQEYEKQSRSEIEGPEITGATLTDWQINTSQRTTE